MHHQYLIVRTHGSKSGRRVAAFSLGILLFSAWLSSTGRCSSKRSFLQHSTQVISLYSYRSPLAGRLYYSFEVWG